MVYPQIHKLNRLSSQSMTMWITVRYVWINSLNLFLFSKFNETKDDVNYPHQEIIVDKFILSLHY